jgi:hypothetical protein
MRKFLRLEFNKRSMHTSIQLQRRIVNVLMSPTISRCCLILMLPIYLL